MSKTLLAVDDSVTMRKVIEMTFAGEDVRVLSVASAQEALATCRREHPDAILADVALEGFSGYDLCRAIKDEFGRIPVVLLSSKQNPFDPARGQAAGADAHMDKPYDTAKAIELVKGVMAQGKSVAPAPVAGLDMGARAPMFTAPQPVPVPPAPPPPAPRPVAPPPQHPTMQGLKSPALGRAPTPALHRQATVRMASEPPPPPPSAPALERKATPALKPQSTVRMASDAPPAARVAIETAPSGTPLPAEMSTRLREMGLTPTQVDAVLALSREVVERVVWEVVPVLAETLIKEEIARLTREG